MFLLACIVLHHLCVWCPQSPEDGIYWKNLFLVGGSALAHTYNPILVCVCVCVKLFSFSFFLHIICSVVVFVRHGNVEAREPCAGVSSFLLPCGSWKSNSGHQTVLLVSGATSGLFQRTKLTFWEKTVQFLKYKEGHKQALLVRLVWGRWGVQRWPTFVRKGEVKLTPEPDEASLVRGSSVQRNTSLVLMVSLIRVSELFVIAILWCSYCSEIYA